jgi:hypothetical protein
VDGQKGNDDLIGHGGDDTLDDRSSLDDWDRAFGGSGNDKINVDDKDTRDEVSCGENATSTTDTPGDNDVLYIDVIRDSSGKIKSADTVHDKDSNGNSVFCETIYAKDQNTGRVALVRGNGVDKEQMAPPPSGAKVASVEPS